MTRLHCLLIGWASLFPFCSVVKASELQEGRIRSSLVPDPVSYFVLLPEGYAESKVPFPLLVLLHGGKSSHEELKAWRPVLDELWAQGKVRKMVVVMPGTGKPTLEGRTEYMDFKDGSQKWYSFLLGPFLEHVRQNYRVAPDGRHTAVAGLSMGGLGALRLGLLNPDKFVALVAWEPSVLPALRWRDVKPRNRFHYSDEFLESIYGKPFDPGFWEANHPAGIAQANAEKIRCAGIKIYLECGDEDFLNLHEGTEFLHRVLWEGRIPHEYHLVLGADHLGRTLARRFAEGVHFIDRAFHPAGPDPDAMRRR